MRTESHELERVGVRLPIDQHEIGPNVAIAVIALLANERMIEMPAWQRFICCQQVNDLHQESVKPLAEHP